MYEKLRAIVLNTVKYSDRSNIVHAFSDVRGRVAFAVPQGNTRGARERNAMLMPLSLVEMEARFMPGRELATMRDLRRTHPLMSIYANPMKNAIAMFVSELLSRVVQQQERDTGLFQYIEASVLTLESTQDGFANFHLCFLYHLGAFIGIQPDMATYTDGRWFDMEGGVFTAGPTLSKHQLNPDDAQAIRLLSRMTYANMHRFRFNREQRSAILDNILTYYRLHHSTLGNLKSPEVLKQLFI